VTILLLESMDSKYRELLRTARVGTGSLHPLFGSSWFYDDVASFAQETAIASQEEKLKPTESLSKEADSKVTEKIKILDSLNVFSEEKLEKRDSFQFTGGA
jgi:hypothetical protein